MPVLFDAPEKPGIYTLRVMPLIEGRDWFPASAITTQVVVEARDVDPLSVDWDADPHARTVQEDHSRALELCREWIGELIASPRPRVVELGGNFYPLAAFLDGDRYNVDIDAFGLMTYNIRERNGATAPVRNIVANGVKLPFEDGSLDVVVMFATFHHFPDPVELLRHLKTKLAPNGIVCLMCEPLGHVFCDTGAHDFLAELNRGVYEQSFMPWEYRDMLDRAGLEVAKVALDLGRSLKLAARSVR